MFGFHKVRPPLTTFQRVDLELLMRKTIETIGEGRVRDAEIVTDLNDLRLDTSTAGRLLETALAAVRRRMPAPAAPYEVDVVDGDDLGYPSVYRAAEDQSDAKILIAEESLGDALRCVMELAYQHARHFWQMQADPTPLDTDPRTTSLLPICCGLGVLASDASLYDEQWSQAGWTGWSISRSGYYNAVEIGYAMALLARARRESDPPWVRVLRLDSRDTVHQAWRYFDDREQKGGSLLFDSRKIPNSRSSMHDLHSWLAGDERTYALAAALALAKQHELPTSVIKAAIAATQRGDTDLTVAATRLLAKSKSVDSDAERRVRELIRSHVSEISLAAILSAAAMDIPLAEFSAKISKLLDWFAGDPFALVDAIAVQGRSLSSLGAKMCSLLVAAIGDLDDERIDTLIECLTRIADDPQRLIETQIKPREVRQEALRRLAVATATSRNHA